MNASRIHWRLIPPLLIALLLQACAGTGPARLSPAPPLAEAHLLDGAETAHDGELDLKIAVLSDERAKSVFGIDLGSRWVHALWVVLDNHSGHPHWLLQPSLDPDYLSPGEVAYRFRAALNDADYATLRQRLARHAFRNPVHAGQRRAGFVFVSSDALDREARVVVVGRDDLLELPVFLPRPELSTDDLPDIHALYPARKIASLNMEQLRQRLRAIGCCTTDASGRQQGDPLNLVIIATPENLRLALTARGWHPAEKNYADSVRKTIASFLFGARYDYSPVSPLYALGRKQDMAMQKARASIDQRNHLRLWLTPWTIRGKNVWIGQISRDIGVRFTTRSPILVTHKIDPDVDEARNYLVEDLLLSGQVGAYGYVRGVGKSSPAHPRHNLTGDPYYSDGLRAIVVIDRGRPTVHRALSRHGIRFLNWDHGALDEEPRHLDPKAIRR